MTGASEEVLREQLRSAFGDVAPPAAEEMIQKLYANSDDAFEMCQAFQGKRWTELPIELLSYHRESVIMLSGVGYRAYLPAYLNACLANDARVGPDVRGYTLYGLRPLSKSAVHVASAHERLSLLDRDQRQAVMAILRYLESTWRMREAGEILREWESSFSPR